MNDLERRVKAALDADASKAPRVSAPPDLRRRVHRRQTMSGVLVGLTMVSTVAVMVIALRIVAPLGDPREPAGVGSLDTRTSTVNGVTISYPDDWALAMLSSGASLGEGSVAQGEVVVGHDVLFLSNIEPASEASSPFPLGCDAPAEGSVALLLRDFGDAPATLGLERQPWPVMPVDGYPERGGDERGFCLPATPIRSISWLAGERLFEAIVVGQQGPALDRLLEAYRTMTFGEAPSWEPPTAPDGSVMPNPRWVLESGEVLDEYWNLSAYATRYPLAPSRVCLGLDINGIAADQMCDLDLASAQGSATGFESRVVRTRADGVVTTYVYGGISPTDAIVTSETAEESNAPLERVHVRTMPASLDAAFAAGISVSPGRPEGLIRVIDPRNGSVGAGAVSGADTTVSLPAPDTEALGDRTVASGVTGGVAWALGYEEDRRLSLGGDGDDVLFDHISPNQMASLSRGNPMLIRTHNFGTADRPRYLLYGVTHHDVDQLSIALGDGEVITFERGALHNPSIHVFGRFPNTSPGVWWEEMPPGPVLAEIVAFDTACEVIARSGLALQPPSSDTSVTVQAACVQGG